MQEVWALPGPRHMINRVLARLRRDRVHVLHAPRDPAGLAAAFDRQLAEDGYGVLAFGPDDLSTFGAGLARRVGGRANRSVGALAGDPALQAAVVIACPAVPCGPELQEFARALRHHPNGTGPQLLLVAADAASSLDGVETEQVRGVVGPLDGAAYAAWLPRPDQPFLGQLVTSVAIEVAAWDLGLLDRLAALPKAQAVRPDLHVAAWDDGRVKAYAGRPSRWELGLIDDWAGEAAEHPAWLAANNPGRLAKRVWQGQLATLLPWIELHRQRLVESRLRGTKSPMFIHNGAELIDWGPLCLCLKEVAVALVPAAEAFRRVRNELAHARPVTWPEIMSCLQQSAKILAPTGPGLRTASFRS